jgi:raffinose/stachyose/melibiose transport system permease protein
MATVTETARRQDVALKAPKRKRARNGREVAGLTVSYLVALVIFAITVVPLLYVIIGGFRTTAQINQSATALPHPWVFDNYKSIITSGKFWTFLRNSVIISVVASALAVGLGSMASLAL